MITKFEVIQRNIDKHKPHFNRRGELVISAINNHNYKWYVSAARNNTNTNDREYFILFGNTKFDLNCYKLTRDYSNNCVICPVNELSEFVNREIKDRGSIEIEYLYSEDDYDVWQLK